MLEIAQTYAKSILQVVLLMGPIATLLNWLAPVVTILTPLFYAFQRALIKPLASLINYLLMNIGGTISNMYTAFLQFITLSTMFNEMCAFLSNAITTFTLAFTEVISLLPTNFLWDIWCALSIKGTLLCLLDSLKHVAFACFEYLYDVLVLTASSLLSACLTTFQVLIKRILLMNMERLQPIFF